MGWSIGYDDHWERDIGYGVPAICDHPDCNEEIDRGLGYVCGGEPYGGERGCGLFFCGKHLRYGMRPLCERCSPRRKKPFAAKPDHPDWISWKLSDESWEDWRKQNPEAVKAMRAALAKQVPAQEQDWISVNDRLPSDGDVVIAWAGDHIVIERWEERHEAPLGWSSATIPIGPAWDDHEFEDITHWMPLPPAPAQLAQSADKAEGE